MRRLLSELISDNCEVGNAASILLLTGWSKYGLSMCVVSLYGRNAQLWPRYPTVSAETSTEAFFGCTLGACKFWAGLEPLEFQTSSRILGLKVLLSEFWDGEGCFCLKLSFDLSCRFRPRGIMFCQPLILRWSFASIPSLGLCDSYNQARSEIGFRSSSLTLVDWPRRGAANKMSPGDATKGCGRQGSDREGRRGQVRKVEDGGVEEGAYLAGGGEAVSGNGGDL
jgi:hypothetical protein